MGPLEFGWYLPTHGDTDRFHESAASIPPSLAMLDRVVDPVERAGFSDILVPFGTHCRDA
jgi:alkanesulfonate monooxygenase